MKRYRMHKMESGHVTMLQDENGLWCLHQDVEDAKELDIREAMPEINKHCGSPSNGPESMPPSPSYLVDCFMSDMFGHDVWSYFGPDKRLNAIKHVSGAIKEIHKIAGGEQ